MVALALALSGCALQAPLSEGLVFQDAGTRTRVQLQPPPVLRPAELGVPLSASLPSARAVRRATPDDPDAGIEKGWRLGLPFPTVVFVAGDRLAVAATPGAILGASVDATVRLAGPYYATASGNIASNYEAVLQRRVLSGRGGGLGLGAYYRREQFGIEGSLLNPTARFTIRSVGGRASFQLPLGARPYAHVRGFVNAGYAFDTDAPTAAVGASVAFQVRR